MSFASFLIGFFILIVFDDAHLPSGLFSNYEPSRSIKLDTFINLSGKSLSIWLSLEAFTDD